MTALNITQEREAAIAWAEIEYRNVDEFTRDYLEVAIKAYIAGRAALAQAPVSTTAMRFVPDSECVQSRCANATTGCRNSCDLRPAGRLHNTFVVAAPVSAENERRLEIALMERNFERAKYDRIMKVMMSVFSLVHAPDDIKLPDGRVMRFNDPNAAETLRALGKAILAIPAAIAAADKGTTS